MSLTEKVTSVTPKCKALKKIESKETVSKGYLFLFFMFLCSVSSIIVVFK